MAIRTEELAVSVPGLRAMRWSSNAPHTGMKESYVIGRVVSGRSQWSDGRRLWHSGPGSLQIKQPGDVHHDVSRDGPITFQVVSFPALTVESAVGRVRVHAQIAVGDARGAVFQRLHDAVTAGVERFALEVIVAEAISAFATIGEATCEHTRPVHRAIDLLRSRLSDPMTLDALAAHAGIDKFALCRAFRAQLGMPPYTYLTQLRIIRAKELLAAGVRPSDVAPRIGLYDQSQLNRHFRRIVGTTPGEYARVTRTRR